ncbi:MAG: sulfotransferase [Steroidobacteraceae bacterium]
MEEQRSTWQPAPRPDWVQKINEEGRCMEISGVVPLDENSLLEAAMRATGLTDFGADDWREPFQVALRSLEDEARLNLMGRIRTRSELLIALEARLQVEDWYKRHPEIEEEEIKKPIIVVGQGRSGTSFLINTLAANPDNGACRQWEMMFPCPPPEKATYRTDPRIEKADQLIKQWIRVTPEMASMHEHGGDLPMECAWLMGLSFRSTPWLGVLGQVPSYEAYMEKQDMVPAYQYHKRVLKLLQWKNPRAHWVLKDVRSLDFMDIELKVYPDACFVWSHRDPVRALASMVSLMGTTFWGRTDYPLSGEAHAYVTDATASAARLNSVIDTLESGRVPKERIHHVHYRNLVGDTMRTIEGIYRYFDIPLSERGRTGMQEYLHNFPRDSRPPHRFSGGSPEFIAQARIAYKRYQDYFNVPSE